MRGANVTGSFASRLRSRAWKSRLVILVLAVSVVIQTITLAESYVLPTGKRVWDLRAQPALIRGGTLLEGRRFAEYLSFVRETVPEDGRVILPPHSTGGPLTNISLVQYFLFPRDIHNCGSNEVEECVLRVTGENTYILALKNFPPREVAAQVKRLVPFDDDIGVYAPPHSP